MGDKGNYPPRYLVAERKRAEGDVYVVLTVTDPSSIQLDKKMGSPYYLQVLEAQKMQAHAKVFVVGHTTTRVAARRTRTSRSRAQSVVDALTKQGVDKGRLQAVGVANVSPVAGNGGGRTAGLATVGWRWCCSRSRRRGCSRPRSAPRRSCRAAEQAAAAAHGHRPERAPAS